MELDEVIQKRHSYRLFTGEQVERELIEQLVNAAALAPSSKNSQPWRFHVATGEARSRVGTVMAMTTAYLQEYMESLGPERLAKTEAFYQDLGKAPVAIAVSVPKLDSESLDKLNAYVSAGAAIENLLLKATALGLGVCSVTFSFWVRDELAEAYGLGADREIVSLVIVGWPAEEPVAPDHMLDVATYHD